MNQSKKDFVEDTFNLMIKGNFVEVDKLFKYMIFINNIKSFFSYSFFSFFKIIFIPFRILGFIILSLCNYNLFYYLLYPFLWIAGLIKRFLVSLHLVGFDFQEIYFTWLISACHLGDLKVVKYLVEKYPQMVKNKDFLNKVVDDEIDLEIYIHEYEYQDENDGYITFRDYYGPHPLGVKDILEYLVSSNKFEVLNYLLENTEFKTTKSSFIISFFSKLDDNNASILINLPYVKDIIEDNKYYLLKDLISYKNLFGINLLIFQLNIEIEEYLNNYNWFENNESSFKQEVLLLLEKKKTYESLNVNLSKKDSEKKSKNKI